MANKFKLDPEEKELLALFKAGKLKKVQFFDDELKKAKEAAKNFNRKDARINVRISKEDLEGLRKIAGEEGLPYQTLVSSILHKFVSNKTPSLR